MASRFILAGFMALMSAMLLACSPRENVEERKDWSFSLLVSDEGARGILRRLGSSMLISPDERTVAAVSLMGDPFAKPAGPDILFFDVPCLVDLGIGVHPDAPAKCLTHAITGPIEVGGATWLGPTSLLVLDGGGTPTLIQLAEGGTGSIARVVSGAGIGKRADLSLRASSPALWRREFSETKIVKKLQDCLNLIKDAAREGRRVHANISGALCGGIVAYDDKTEAVWVSIDATGHWARDVKRAILPSARFHWNDAEVFETQTGIEVWGQNSILELSRSGQAEVPMAGQAPVWSSRGGVTNRISLDRVCAQIDICGPRDSEIKRDWYIASAVQSLSAGVFIGTVCDAAFNCTIGIFNRTTAVSISGTTSIIATNPSADGDARANSIKTADDWTLPVHVYRGEGPFQALVYLQGGPGVGGRAGLGPDQFVSLRDFSQEILVPQYSGARGISRQHYERLRSGLSALDADMRIFCKMLVDSGRIKPNARIPVIAASMGGQAALSLLKTPCAPNFQMVFGAPLFRLPGHFSMRADTDEQSAWRADWNAAWVRFSFGVDRNPGALDKLQAEFDSRIKALDQCNQCGLIIGEADNLIDNVDVCPALMGFPYSLLLTHQTHSGAAFSREALAFTRAVFDRTAKSSDERSIAMQLVP